MSELERKTLLEGMFRDVASIAVEKSYNTDTGRPYSISMLQNAMKDIHYSISLSKSAKQQALDVIRRLRKVMPIARTKLSLRITTPSAHATELEAMLLSNTAEIVKNTSSSSSSAMGMPPLPPLPPDTMDSDQSRGPVLTVIEAKIHPENFRSIEDLTTSITQGKGILEIIHQQQTMGQSGVKEDEDDEEDGGEERVHIVSQAEDNKKTKGKQNTQKNDSGKDDSDEVVFFMAKSGKSGSKKKKDKKKLAKQMRQALEEEEDEAAGSDSDVESSASASLAALRMLEEEEGRRRVGEGGETKTPKEGKKSKKNKRLEKEKKKVFDSSELERSERLEALESERVAKKAQAEEGSTASLSTSQQTGGVGAFKCNTCCAHFEQSLDHRAHFKSDWHRINLKRKLLKLPLIQSEEEFYSVPVDQWDCNIDELA